MTDPRSSIKTLLDTYITNDNLTRDDDATQLSWHSLYAPYFIPLTRLFHDKELDLIFSISDTHASTTTLGVAHVGFFMVTPHAIDKFDSGDTRVITATLALWKATKELRRVFKENPWGSSRSFVEENIKVHDFGNEQVWSKPCMVEYKTYSR